MQTSLVRCLTLGATIAVVLSVAPAHAQNKCDAGKLKCMAKKAQCLLKVYEKAIKKGEVPDAEKIAKCEEKFDDPAKGCIAKVESKQKPDKPDTICTTVGNTIEMAAIVDTCVTDSLDGVETGGVPNPTPTPTPGPGSCGTITDGFQCVEGICPAGEVCVAVVEHDSFPPETVFSRCGCAPIPACGGCGGTVCDGSGCPTNSTCLDLCFLPVGEGCLCQEDAP